MGLVLIIMELVVGLLFVGLGIIGIKSKERGICVAFAIAAILLIIGVSHLIVFKNTDWKIAKTEDIGEIEESKYIQQFDDKYVYGIKNIEKDTVELAILQIDTNTVLEIKYLEKDEKAQMHIWTRWQDYREFEKYVFYVPKTE